MGPKSMARAAHWAAGIAGFDMSCDAAAIGAASAAFSAAWVNAGRTGLPWLQSSAWFSLRSDAAEKLNDYVFNYLRIFGDDIASALAGMQKLSTPSAIRDALKAVADTGLNEFILVATTSDLVNSMSL
jgi:hypothetical protein